MILRGVHVEHWRCIARLDLAGLPAGVVVLHGPNRTGKSSLVKALRAGLFDFDHNTRGEEFKKNVPWQGGTPRVAVEFETVGEVYRITKVFSPRSDGTARLERRLGDRWVTEEASPKEACRRTKELLGGDSSRAGLNQLLWLDQGTVTLPRPKELDATLEKRLLNVLGVLVTGRDHAFKQLLDRRWSDWYTPTGRDKESSRLSHLEREREKRQHILEEEERKYREIEQVVRDLERCEDELPPLRRAAEWARAEAEGLRAERERTRERRRQYEQAEQDHRAAEQRLGEAEGRLRACAAARERQAQGAHAADQAEAALRQAQAEGDRLALLHADRDRALRAARQAEEAHQGGRDELEDRRRLLHLAQERARLDEALGRVRQLEEELAGLGQQIEAVVAPDAGALKELQQNRRAAAALRARLKATALTLAVVPDAPLRLRLRLDGQAEQTLDLPPGERRDWVLRQRATLEVPGVGRVELARSQEDEDLERAAQTLAGLDRAFAEAARACGEDQADEACLDRLAERRHQREKRAESRQRVQRDLAQAAPHGRAALEAEVRDLDRQQQVIRARRPDLAAWQPRADDVAECERLFQAEAARLQKLRGDAEAGEADARRRAEQAAKQWQGLKEQLAALRATAKAAEEELQRLGEEPALQGAVAQARQAVERAARRLAEAALTDEEKSLDRRAGDADAALRQREERLRQLEGEVHRLRGRLEGSEGLHTRRADAETALRETEQQLDRERLDADAHRRLRELFEACRESQVQRVVGPVGGRVLGWARHLGLDDYREFRFGDHFLPEGLVPRGVETPVALSEESYGTDEQLSLLVRLALGGVAAQDEPAVAVLDDPLAHADPVKQRKILEILKVAAEGNAALQPPAGRLQILILTCHPDRFDHLPGAHAIDLARLIRREA